MYKSINAPKANIMNSCIEYVGLTCTHLAMVFLKANITMGPLVVLQTIVS